jgi:hypothetical protein
LSRSGWSVVRNASLAKGDTSKKRPSPHLHKVPTRRNKVSPRTLQTVLVHTYFLNLIYYSEEENGEKKVSSSLPGSLSGGCLLLIYIEPSSVLNGLF